MDKRVLRERMRKKQQQIRRRQMMKKGAYVVAVILVLIFVIRGIILPVINRAGGGNTEKPQQVQAETDSTTADSSSDSTDTGDTSTETNAAIRQPVKGQSDLTKAAQLTAGWHDDENGKWYQNADGTYFAGGMQEIDGSTYYFDDNGYIKTGWVEVGFDDYYFNDDGTYDPSQHKTRIALTFDDGPGEYTDELLDCLEENNAHATFFMLGQNVGSWESTVQRMADIGCEIGSHSWDHPNLYDLSMDSVAKEFSDTDAALEKACGQKASVARAPYGNWSDDIISTVGKPFFTWSLDSLDWSYLDVNKDYDAVMNGDLTDGSIILMHDIHEPSVQAAIKMIPELVQKGYKLMTVSELAAAKGVTLQNANYSDFWDSSLQKGIVAGYSGNTTDASGDESTDGTDTSTDGSSDTSDGSSDDGSSDDESLDDGSYDDGSSDDGSSDDGSSDDESLDDGSYDDGSSDDGSSDDGDYSEE
ncbi:polysaccharide deacetylase family protein [Blautia sp. 2744]|uniref:Polysaccharide deacetylase family protein n=1 Tax=Blautia intestinalis TaxID=2763028 RepID=A0ABR7I2T3_9FIRM|nr:polysaccharide deacetylase family protein [Blautia intestinalis]MBC5740801.1 polysaccharide deacetylase family protein [Blautia intestinalis]RHD32198.1 polysaccharide deacetylase [Blautia obeum]